MQSTFLNQQEDLIEQLSPNDSKVYFNQKSKAPTLKQLLQLEGKQVKAPAVIHKKQMQVSHKRVKSSLEVKLEEDLNKLKGFTLARRSAKYDQSEKRNYASKVGTMIHVS